MRLAAYAAALALAVSPVAAECPKPVAYAVQFNVYKTMGGGGWDVGLGRVSNARLGELHWKLRKMGEWATTLSDPCLRSNYLMWTNGGFQMLEDEAARRRAGEPHLLDSDESDQLTGHLLANHIPSPP